MQDVSQGAERNRAWPRDRGKTISPKTRQQMEWFRQMQWACKFMDPKLLASAEQATRGTPLLPRDLLTMISAGRFVAFITEDNREIWPVQALQDVSASLDIIGNTPGSTLLRGPTYWGIQPPLVGTQKAGTIKRTSAFGTGPGSTFNPVVWESAPIDQGPFWNIADPTKIVVGQSCLLQYTFTTRWAATGAMEYYLTPLLNGDFVQADNGNNVNGGFPMQRTISGQLWVQPTDTLQFAVWCNNGALTINSADLVVSTSL